MTKRLIALYLYILALSLGMLGAAVHPVQACSPTATPFGFVASPALSESELLDSATRDADVIFEGTVLDVWTESFRQVMVVEVGQYLKGKGGDIVRLVGYINPCPYAPVYVGTHGLFFTRNGSTNDTPLRQLARFVPNESTVQQVSTTAGTQPFIPPRSPSLAGMTLFSLMGLLTVSAIVSGWVIRSKRLSRLQNRDKTIAYYESPDMISRRES
jgi:hypothetical protein